MNELFCDGGCVKANPSPYAGTWAWCYVVDGEMVYNQSGIIYPKAFNSKTLTNNQSELVALLAGLSFLPLDWIGVVKSDSQVSLGRVFQGWKFKRGIPAHIILRYQEIKKKFLYWDQIKWVLLSGHPTKKELETGIGKNGLPVSKWNVWCDHECGRLSKEFTEKK
jgi:ribonuclease HI